MPAVAGVDVRHGNPSEELGEEGEGGDGNGGGAGKAVGGDVGGVEDDLEGMGGAGEALEVGEGGREPVFGGLGFGEEPGGAVADNEKIDFAFLLVAEVEQLEGAQSQVGPAFDGLEEVAGEEGFVALSGVGDGRPVAEIPFRGFAEGGLDVAVPGADGEPEIEGAKEGNPALDGGFGDSQVAGEGRIGEKCAGAVAEDEGKGFDQGEVGGAGEVAEVFAEELFEAEPLPFPEKTGLPEDEGFGKAAEGAQGVPESGVERGGRADEGVAGEVRGEEFGDGPRGVGGGGARVRRGGGGVQCAVQLDVRMGRWDAGMLGQLGQPGRMGGMG